MGRARDRGKGTAYDASVRVPMYVRWPGHFTAGATDNRMVANLDLAPTIADAVGGIAPGVPMDGRSLLDPLQNRTRMLTEYEGEQTDFEPGWAALRTLTSHYIEHYADADRQRIVHREYYDLFADPFELDNLLGDAQRGERPEHGRAVGAAGGRPRVRRARLPVARAADTATAPDVWLSWPAMSTFRGGSSIVALLAAAALALGACGGDDDGGNGDHRRRLARVTTNSGTTTGTTGTTEKERTGTSEDRTTSTTERGDDRGGLRRLRRSGAASKNSGSGGNDDSGSTAQPATQPRQRLQGRPDRVQQLPAEADRADLEKGKRKPEDVARDYSRGFPEQAGRSAPTKAAWRD